MLNNGEYANSSLLSLCIVLLVMPSVQMESEWQTMIEKISGPFAAWLNSRGRKDCETLAGKADWEHAIRDL